MRGGTLTLCVQTYGTVGDGEVPSVADFSGKLRGAGAESLPTARPADARAFAQSGSDHDAAEAGRMPGSTYFSISSTVSIAFAS